MNQLTDRPNLSDTDKVSIAAKHVLTSDTFLMEWTGGRIARTGSPVPVLEMGVPQILVAPVSEGELFQPSVKSKIMSALGLVICWEEVRRVLNDDEPSISSVISHVKALLLDNYYLNGPPFNQRLTRRLDQFQPVDYAAEMLDDGHILRYIVLGIDYEVDIHARTRKVAC